MNLLAELVIAVVTNTDFFFNPKLRNGGLLGRALATEEATARSTVMLACKAGLILTRSTA